MISDPIRCLLASKNLEFPILTWLLFPAGNTTSMEKPPCPPDGFHGHTASSAPAASSKPPSQCPCRHPALQWVLRGAARPWDLHTVSQQLGLRLHGKNSHLLSCSCQHKGRTLGEVMRFFSPHNLGHSVDIYIYF